MTVDIAADVLGKEMTTAKVVRVFAVVDGETAELVVVRNGDAGIDVARRELFGISRSGYGRNRQYLFTLAGGMIYGVFPQSCSCGAGEIAYYDPMPGEERRVIRVPDWLET